MFKNYDPIKGLPSFYLKLPKPSTDIPTTDDFAWISEKKYRWIVYNKLLLVNSQLIPSGPTGVEPPLDVFPIVVKPIMNIYGGSIGVQKVRDIKEYDSIKNPGLFWMKYLNGNHYSIDMIVKDGVVLDDFCFRGEKHPLFLGAFDYWELVETPSSIYNYVSSWIKSYLSTYSGCLNVEVIGNNIIESHLRMGDIDRFGNFELMSAIIDLYDNNYFKIDYKKPTEFYITALFGNPKVSYKINKSLAKNLCSRLVTYYQIDKPDFYFINPPEAIRLAIFCDYDFNNVIEARNTIISLFKPNIEKKFLVGLKNF